MQCFGARRRIEIEGQAVNILKTRQIKRNSKVGEITLDGMIFIFGSTLKPSISSHSKPHTRFVRGVSNVLFKNTVYSKQNI